MCGSQFLRTFRFGPVGIDPSMQFHAPCMTLGYHPLQRIPVGRRRRALLSGQITAPRLEAAGIKRVELGTYLKQDGIDTALLQFIQLVRQRTLHLCRIHAPRNSRLGDNWAWSAKLQSHIIKSKSDFLFIIHVISVQKYNKNPSCVCQTLTNFANIRTINENN